MQRDQQHVCYISFISRRFYSKRHTNSVYRKYSRRPRVSSEWQYFELRTVCEQYANGPILLILGLPHNACKCYKKAYRSILRVTTHRWHTHKHRRPGHALRVRLRFSLGQRRLYCLFGNLTTISTKHETNS